jgi:hypothetical protein
MVEPRRIITKKNEETKVRSIKKRKALHAMRKRARKN